MNHRGTEATEMQKEISGFFSLCPQCSLWLIFVLDQFLGSRQIPGAECSALESSLIGVGFLWFALHLRGNQLAIQSLISYL